MNYSSYVDCLNDEFLCMLFDMAIEQQHDLNIYLVLLLGYGYI